MIDRVLDPATRVSLSRLSLLIEKKEFYLAGGTGCALHLGHRMSQDLDFFSRSAFDPLKLEAELRLNGECITDYTDAGTWVGQFERTKAGFFHYPYPLLEKTVSFRHVPVASLDDIGCMKLEAISGRGRKRDFVDLYFILKDSEYDFRSLWELFNRKYAKQKHNAVHIMKGLVYFADAEADPEPLMLVEYSWPEIKRALSEIAKTFAI